MKINQPNQFLFGLLTILFSLVCLCGTVLAISTVTPARSVISPTDGSLYAVDNSRAVINVYTYASSSWTKSTELALATGSQCYGLAVSPDGNNLYVSVSNGSSSEIRIYTLPLVDATTYTTMSGATWSSSSSPAGLIVGGENRLFVVDQSCGRFRIYDTSTNTYIKQISTGGISGLSNLYDIAVTSTSDTTYKIYISLKASTGSVFVYDYDATTDTATYNSAISTGLTYPTFLKIYNSQLFVSVNGTDGVDVRVYNTSDDSLAGTVSNSSGITGSYGWTAFDTVSSGYLLYKKSADSSEIINRFYKIAIADIASGSTASILATSVIKSDSVVIANDKTAIALTDSDTGSIEVLDNSRGRYFSISSTPSSPESLTQYAMDGTTLLSSLSPANYINYNYGRTYAAYDTTYSTFTSRIKLKFSATDPSGSAISRVKIYYKQPSSTTWSTSTYYTGSFTLEGSNYCVTFPQAGGLPREGAWEWGASVFNGTYWSDITYYNGTTNEADFNLDTTLPRSTYISPTNLATNVSTKQQIVIDFNESMDTASTKFSWLCTDEAGVTYEGFSAPVWNAASTEVTITHEADSRFALATTYRLSIDAVDLAGNNVSSWDSYYLGARTDIRNIRFTTRATNDAPGVFNLISPINGQLTNTTPPFSWDSSVDPNGDAVTYNLSISDEAGTSIYAGTTTSPTLTLTSPLAIGKYLWTVYAIDSEGAITTAANAPASFEVVADTAGNPTVVTAIPTDESIAVPLSQVVTLTFSEPMDTASVTSSPSVVWGSASWDSSRTMATFTHEAFAVETLYAITVTGQDLYGSAVDVTASSAALGSNGTLDLTSSSAESSVIISGVSIVRDGDTSLSSVIISWTSTPAGSVDIWTKSGTFSAVATDWTLAYSGVSSTSQPDGSQVGNGISKYYKVVTAGHSLIDSDLTSEVVGKFDYNIIEGTNLISLPLIPTDTSLSAAIGNQLNSGTPATADKIYQYDALSVTWLSSYLSTSGWSGSLASIEVDKGYFVDRQVGSGTVFVSVVGTVCFDSSRNINLYQGDNMVGTLFPQTVNLDSANLASVLTSGTPATADKVYYFDAATSSWISSYLSSAGTFSGGLASFEPGKGYYVENQALLSSPDPDNWSYTK